MIHYTEHAEIRMRQYGISREEVEDTLQSPILLFFDVASNRYVAIGKKNGHSLVVVYEVAHSEKVVVTAYHTSKVDKIIRAKLSTGRWIEL
ncbi:DUF4258 domain-containing protein [Thermococcus sp.]